MIYAKTLMSFAAVGLITFLSFGSARAGQQQLAAAMRETRTEILQTRDQLQATVDAISALVKQKKGDLKPTYDAFVSQVASTRTAAAATRARAQRMQAEADTHFGGWQKELDSINNEKLKNKAIRRLQDVQKDYDRVSNKMKEAADKFEPYLSDLGDMQKMLSNDLSPDGVKNLRGTVSDAKFHLQGVRAPLNDAVKRLDDMAKSLSSTVGE